MRRWVWAACIVIFLVLPAGCRGPRGPNPPLPVSGLDPAGLRHDWERDPHDLDARITWGFAYGCDR
jgi:hypothetical protein